LTKNSIPHKTLLKDINIIWHKRSITWGRNWWWSAGDLWKFRGCKRKFTWIFASKYFWLVRFLVKDTLWRGFIVCCLWGQRMSFGTKQPLWRFNCLHGGFWIIEFLPRIIWHSKSFWMLTPFYVGCGQKETTNHLFFESDFFVLFGLMCYITYIGWGFFVPFLVPHMIKWFNSEVLIYFWVLVPIFSLFYKICPSTLKFDSFGPPNTYFT
jgi:hypothetical protein